MNDESKFSVVGAEFTTMRSVSAQLMQMIVDPLFYSESDFTQYRNTIAQVGQKIREKLGRLSFEENTANAYLAELIGTLCNESRQIRPSFSMQEQQKHREILCQALGVDPMEGLSSDQRIQWMLQDALDTAMDIEVASRINPFLPFGTKMWKAIKAFASTLSESGEGNEAETRAFFEKVRNLWEAAEMRWLELGFSEEEIQHNRREAKASFNIKISNLSYSDKKIDVLKGLCGEVFAYTPLHEPFPNEVEVVAYRRLNPENVRKPK